MSSSVLTTISHDVAILVAQMQPAPRVIHGSARGLAAAARLGDRRLLVGVHDEHGVGRANAEAVCAGAERSGDPVMPAGAHSAGEARPIL